MDGQDKPRIGTGLLSGVVFLYVNDETEPRSPQLPGLTCILLSAERVSRCNLQGLQKLDEAIALVIRQKLESKPRIQSLA